MLWKRADDFLGTCESVCLYVCLSLESKRQILCSYLFGPQNWISVISHMTHSGLKVKGLRGVRLSPQLLPQGEWGGRLREGVRGEREPPSFFKLHAL